MKIAGVGFAMPGPFDYLNGIALFRDTVKKYVNLYGLDLPKVLYKAMCLPYDFPIRFVNDATAFAIGEDLIGKAKGTINSLSYYE